MSSKDFTFLNNPPISPIPLSRKMFYPHIYYQIRDDCDLQRLIYSLIAKTNVKKLDLPQKM